MLLVTLAILIGLLALAIPVAAGLGVLGLSLSAIYSKLPLSLAMGEIAWGTSNNFLLVAIPVLRAAGRDPAALRHGRAHVQRAGPLGALAAGRAHAFQHRRLRHVRRHLRLERGDGGDDRHRGAGRGREARLFRAPVPRHDRRRRHARHPDPAVDQHDRLRRADRHLDPQALSRGLHPGSGPRQPVQPDGDRDLPAAAGRRRNAD